MQTLSQLSYFPKNSGTPGGIRTPYPLVRSQVLYPNELRAYIFGAIEGTRTPSIPLDRRTLYHWVTTAINLVLLKGLEPSSSAWKAVRFTRNVQEHYIWWMWMDSNHRVFRSLIYSQVQSTTLPHILIWYSWRDSNPPSRLEKPVISPEMYTSIIFGALGRNRTYNALLFRQALYQLSYECEASHPRMRMQILGWLVGFEPTTTCFTDKYSNRWTIVTIILLAEVEGFEPPRPFQSPLFSRQVR